MMAKRTDRQYGVILDVLLVVFSLKLCGLFHLTAVTLIRLWDSKKVAREASLKN